MYCSVCGEVNEHYDENSNIHHDHTPKHICNVILFNYKNNKKSFSKNRDGIKIVCNAESTPLKNYSIMKVENSDKHKIRIFAKPGQSAKFSFNITNDMKKEDLLFVGVQLAHPQPQFTMNKHPYQFGKEPHVIKTKSTIEDVIYVIFGANDIGQYEMPIMFTFHRKSDKKNLIFIREMVVLIQDEDYVHTSNKTPYKNEDWIKADHYIPSTSDAPYETLYKVPTLLKALLPRGLEESSLENMALSHELMGHMRILLITTRSLMDEGISSANYIMYFHHLLWWEECIARINLKKYNMSNVKVEKRGDVYVLEVPGLAEKRPSLLRGDRVLLRPCENNKVIFESTIKNIDDSNIHLDNLDETFKRYYGPDAEFNVRFLMSRVPIVRAHDAVSHLFLSKQECRVFPVPVKKPVKLKPINKFYNHLIATNEEQRSAVEHIVAGTSGRAPYIVFGPPGTGKTMTIVEAIVQLVVRNPRNRVMVCTDSNMAADHIAVTLLQYNKTLNINNFLLRANSQSREWSVMPAALAPVSNGTKYENFFSVSNVRVAQYRVFVTTLLHAAKYASPRNQMEHKLQMTHLFIDEAAQASEPAALVPVTGLLAPSGQLVLAGDPQQLGPVCISREASDRGLGQSLLERLKTTYENLYSDSNYITMLVNNFRSDPDILAIPNELFYDNCLRPLAPPDELSRVSVLGLPGGDRAAVFHAVNSREQRMGNAPSYFNEKELDMLKRYIKALIQNHAVLPKDIGVIAPYIRQVYKMKSWLTNENYKEIEVGTVESFQGKEKRVILVSTVRANCRLLDYDAKYGLGFLVDDKRYNVTLTRAKAKIIIIGNPTCLTRDSKWRRYMDFCKINKCYHGEESQQLDRNSKLLTEIAKTNFDRCRISEELKAKTHKNNKKKF